MVSFTLYFRLHRIKSLKFCEIVSFDNLLFKYFRLKQHVYEKQLTDHSLTANSLLLSQKFEELLVVEYDNPEENVM